MLNVVIMSHFVLSAVAPRYTQTGFILSKIMLNVVIMSDFVLSAAAPSSTQAGSRAA
jgi:hypothetical protein